MALEFCLSGPRHGVHCSCMKALPSCQTCLRPGEGKGGKARNSCCYCDIANYLQRQSGVLQLATDVCAASCDIPEQPFIRMLGKWKIQQRPSPGIIAKPKEPLDISLESSLWEDSGAVVEQIYIYPMKSAKGIPLSTAFCGPYGLFDGVDTFDRSFMIIEVKDNDMPQFVTARMYPKIVMIRVEVVRPDNGKGEPHLSLRAADGDPSVPAEALLVPLPRDVKDTQLVETAVFGQACFGVDLGESAGRWITNYLRHHHKTGKTFAILYNPYHPDRFNSNQYQRKDESEFLPTTKADDVPLYADGYPFLMFSQESITSVNKHLQERKIDLEVEKKRFRPNIFIRNCRFPFEEDTFWYVKINNTVFRNAGLCARCIFTTVDPDKGELNPKVEPLKTLRSFRLSDDEKMNSFVNNSPFFGVNLGTESPGQIHVGDKIYVIRIRSNSSLNQVRWALYAGLVAAAAAGLAFVLTKRG